MSTKMLLTAKLDQRLVMNQQLRQAITLLQYNTIDLKQLVQQFIETNPLIDVIEATEEHEYIPTNRFSAEINRSKQYFKDDDTLENYSAPKGLRQHLLEQTWLCKFDLLQQEIAESIIDSIDDNGRLTLSLEDIQQSFFGKTLPSLSLMQQVLTVIQTFDPLGIAARDLRECLLIQLNQKPNNDDNLLVAKDIIENHYELLSSGNTRKLLIKLAIPQKSFNEVLNMLRSLHPNPGQQYSDELNTSIEPELYVKKVRNTWRVYLAESLLTNIKINHQYQELIKQSKQHGSYEALNKELQEAQWLLKGLKRRNETLLNVATSIIAAQNDFIDHGPAHMRPMVIAEVAKSLSLHESTVSRVTNGKYISTPRGIFELKYFFSSHVSTQSGDVCSATSVQTFIKEIIAEESSDHIFSDGEIADILQKKGINIARRTVAKYREAMNISPSYQRAKMHSMQIELTEPV